MRIDFPRPGCGREMAALWQEAFGDSLEFIEGFFCTGYSPARCRCVTQDGQVIGALYWLDGRYKGRRYAYIYAVATAKAHRGKGICAQLMADTHAHLALRGYAGALLVPQTEALRRMYGKMGYVPCTTVSEFTCEASGDAISLTRIDREEYAWLRRELLPADGVEQDAESIAYLETMAFFYKGDGLILAAHAENGKLRCPELLGDPAKAPQVLAALRCREGSFRTPGKDKAFAMFRPLAKDAEAPGYLGLAFD